MRNNSPVIFGESEKQFCVEEFCDKQSYLVKNNLLE